MKRIILICTAALGMSLAAQAQEANDVWKGRTRYTNISYSIAQTAPENSEVEKSSFGLAITKGTSYLFPKKALGNMVKIGFDVNWVDISVAKYSATGSSTGWSNEINADEIYYDDEDDEEFGGLGFLDMDKLLNMGRLNVMVGALGIGPNVTVAPLSMLNNDARFLKASIYFHYQPTVGMYMLLDDGDMEASYAYCNMYQFGGKISWKFIGLGVEGHWGSGNFKKITFGDGDDEGGSDKYKRRFANTRVYLSFTF